MAIGAITITSARELKVDFSKPFMDFKISLLMPKPTKEDLNLFGFLLPFEMDVWLSTIAVVSCFSLFYQVTRWVAQNVKPSTLDTCFKDYAGAREARKYL